MLHDDAVRTGRERHRTADIGQGGNDTKSADLHTVNVKNEVVVVVALELVRARSRNIEQTFPKCAVIDRTRTSLRIPGDRHNRQTARSTRLRHVHPGINARE